MRILAVSGQFALCVQLLYVDLVGLASAVCRSSVIYGSRAEHWSGYCSDPGILMDMASHNMLCSLTQYRSPERIDPPF